MPPQVIPMSTVRRLYPNAESIATILASHPPGAVFGIITKMGANSKTRTLTTLKRIVHDKTLRIFWERKDRQIHDELEETVPTDLVLVRHIGFLSTRKRLAFDCFISRVESPDDAPRRAGIAEQEAARLKHIETAALERSNLLQSRADLVRRANLAGTLPEDLRRIEEEAEDLESELEMEREREKRKIQIEREVVVDRLRKEIIARLRDGLEAVEGEEAGTLFETLSEQKRKEIVERELRKEVKRVGNEAAQELDYEDLEREVDFRVQLRRERQVWLEKEAQRRVEAEQKEQKERELRERRETVERMQAALEAKRAHLAKQQELTMRKMEELALARSKREAARSTPPPTTI